MSVYDETVAWLQSLEVTSGWDLKLERMRAALGVRGDPQRRFPALHVAGTNGKGSTAAMVEAVLRAGGYRTGLYTSPHLVDFAERIRAGGRTMPHAEVVRRVAALRAALDTGGIALTHFEFVTLLAFEWFADIGVDAAVVEVGLGGRLDATNLVEPIVTAVTSIAHDHEEWLGSRLEEIAAEKAGILKPGVPAVLGPLPQVADAVVSARAAELGVPLVRVPRDAAIEETGEGLGFRGPHGIVWDRLTLGLGGRFQRDNAAVALAMLATVRDRLPCPARAARVGLAGVRWPGRLAIVNQHPLVVVDGAHNPAGAGALAGELPALVGDRPIILCFAVMADKAWRPMLEVLLPLVAGVVVTRVGRRGLDPLVVAEALSPRAPVEAVPEPRSAIRRAVDRAGREGAVVVAGSLFLAGEAYATLATGGLFEPWQSWNRDGTEAAP